MTRIMWNSVSAMQAQQEKLDSISNNIANVNTEGYKREEIQFKDLVYETLNRNGIPISNNADRVVDPSTGTGVKASSWLRDNKQGNLQDTGTNTDLAIDGEGYFRVTQSNGSKAYERGGSFNIDGNGDIVDKNGNKLDIDLNNGDVKFSENNFLISSNGEVSYKEGDKDIPVGKINLYKPIGDDSFLSIGNNLFQPKSGTTVNTVSNADILQGKLEISNVDLSKEMSDMIVTQRAFQLSSKGIETGDQMWSMANNLRK